MSDATEDKAVKHYVPKCPYCNADPLPLRRIDAHLPGPTAEQPAIIAAVIFCESCRASLGMIALGIVPPQPKKIIEANMVPPKMRRN